MALGFLEVIAPRGRLDTIAAISEDPCVVQMTTMPTADKDVVVVRLITRAQGRQQLLDSLQRALGAEEDWRISLIPIDASIPDKPGSEEEQSRERNERTSRTREELFYSVSASAAPRTDFFLLTGLAAIVAAAGLIGDNTAVVIGAMVIAPLLGPNIALALGAALGSPKLIARGALALTAGVVVAVLLGFVMAELLGAHKVTHELALRVIVGPESAVLALAAGAAAALSLTSGASMTLVGVMVAVALLPPAVTVGVSAAIHDMDAAAGAGGLLIVNVAAVNLAAQAVFFYRGIRPKTWLEQKVANQSSLVSAGVWCALLAAVLGVALWLR
jgi:uncharacterized hydrophobic protein (TIGR00341 family)